MNLQTFTKRWFSVSFSLGTGSVRVQYPVSIRTAFVSTQSAKNLCADRFAEQFQTDSVINETFWERILNAYSPSIERVEPPC